MGDTLLLLVRIKIIWLIQTYTHVILGKTEFFCYYENLTLLQFA